MLFVSRSLLSLLDARGLLPGIHSVSDPVSVAFTGYANVTQGSDQALTEAAYKFPIISVGIDASALAFQFYRSGFNGVCSD